MFKIPFFIDFTTPTSSSPSWLLLQSIVSFFYLILTSITLIFLCFSLSLSKLNNSMQRCLRWCFKEKMKKERSFSSTSSWLLIRGWLIFICWSFVFLVPHLNDLSLYRSLLNHLYISTLALLILISCLSFYLFHSFFLALLSYFSLVPHLV